MIFIITTYFNSTMKSQCKVGLTGFVENMYKGVEFDAFPIHCSLQVTEKLLCLLVRVLLVGAICSLPLCYELPAKSYWKKDTSVQTVD